MFHVPEKYRIKNGTHRSTAADGNNGAFWIDVLRNNRPFLVLATDGEGWEHVSVSKPYATSCPPWEVMCAIKDLFWDAEDVVVQFHPPRSQYVNFHPHTLHLWRPYNTNDYIELPHWSLVGPRI